MATSERPRLGVNHTTVVPTNFEAKREQHGTRDGDRDAEAARGDRRQT